MIAVEPERSTAVHDALAAGRPVPVTPDSIADGLSGPFAGEHALATIQAHGVESMLVTEQEIEEAFRFLYERAKLACEPAGAVGCRGDPGREGGGRPDRRCCLWRQRGHRNCLCYSGSAMKSGIHPEYVSTHVRCSCGNEFETRSTQAEIHVDVCSACHPFYTGKQKLMDAGGRVERFQRRLEKAGGARRG